MHSYKEVKRSDNPKLLVITPLLPSHTVSENCRKAVESAETELDWITYAAEQNVAKNAQDGLIEYIKINEKCDIKWVIKLDGDVEPSEGFIDKIVTHGNRVKILKNNIGYIYPNLIYSGAINASFPATSFNERQLKHNNYITSNSLIDFNVLKKVGGFITDQKYKRLLDWALWLHMLNNGYVGEPCKDATILAHALKDSVSAGSVEEFNVVRKRVLEDFVK